MKSYRLYWIEDEVADYFYGRERAFYNLFLESKIATGQMEEIVLKQVQYITKPIPFLPFNRALSQALSIKKEYIQNDNRYYIESSCGKNTAKISVLDYYVKVELQGHSDWEAYIFELLRKLDGRLLAINLEHEQFGWLKPIKMRKYV
ncbi:sporulation inhibitor of replication protein SirA [Rossellomorea vietnamensis]|uniref:Sporulation inhibitor of replication protein SirA n=2 Tax=Rossellomorea TaxID=2837508 RepID=A0A5D4KJP3_9BACI|nr:MULTISPECIES: sporulation inhibitor of replication protein SirA [Rossellomorea]TYR77398.1 sporulation inhibitor of replication protein SirA [Rossellomorea vietnamensis]TYS82346.1 sporulation inhibitor of replication protein SirA [Rossellomorea aquimaris]